MRRQHRDVGGAGIDIHRQHADQHQNRAEECVEEELEGRIDTPLAAPDTDDDEHRDQHTLEEQIEHQHVERGEHADHHRLEDKEGDHIFAHPVGDGLPAGENGQRRQEGRQQDEGHRDAVHAKVIADAGPRKPFGAFFKLVAGGLGIEIQHQS